MKEQLIESIQHASASKAALAVGVGTATAPGWMGWINGLVSSDNFGSLMVIVGALVSITIIVVNIQSIIIKARTSKQTQRQERIRTALLEAQAAEKHITID